MANSADLAMPESEEMFEKLTEQAVDVRHRQARRLQLVGQLTGGILHDFNNIFTAIAGTLEILTEAVADRPEFAAVTRLADQATTRGAGLALDLMAFMRGAPAQPRAVDINTLLANAVRLLRPVMGRQIEIDMSLATDAVPATVDGVQFTTAIFYLALDMRDAIPDGGKLAFTTRAALCRDIGAHVDDEVAAVDDVVVAINASNAEISMGDPLAVLADLDMARDCLAPSGGRIEVRSEAGRGIGIRIHLSKATI
jgi:signal transduction histidine kinase